MSPSTPQPSALITGGTSGIGRAIVERLAADGLRVAFTGRDATRGATVAAATGAAFIQADSTDRPSCDRGIETALAFLKGRIDVLVTSAGIVFEGPLKRTPEPVLRELIEVNLTAVFRYSRSCFSVMRAQRGGVMVHIASDAAIRGIPKLAAYSVAKAAVVTASELWAAEGAPYGIRCNAVCPGATYPGVQATAAGYEHQAEAASDWAPARSGRHGRGADVAGLVAWLISDEASHMSGATLRLDGAATAALDGITLA